MKRLKQFLIVGALLISFFASGGPAFATSLLSHSPLATHSNVAPLNRCDPSCLAQG